MSKNWEERELSEFISIKHGFAFKGEFFKDSPTYDLLVTPGNFAIGGGFKGNKYKYYAGPVPNNYILSEGDLVVTMTDLSKEADTLGYSALIPGLNHNRLLHNQRVGLVEFKSDELDKIYLFYLLRSRSYRHHVISGATGTTVKHTAPKKIVSYRFKLPSITEQRNIGEYLLSIEKKIELNRKTNETLEQMAQALFKSWFVDFDPVIDNALDAGNPIPEELEAKAEKRKKLREAIAKGEAEAHPLPVETRALFPSEFEHTEEMDWIPKGWGVNTIESVAKNVGMGPFGSNIKTSTFVESGVPIINGQQLSGLLLKDGKNNFITDEHANNLNKCVVRQGDIVLTHRGTIGQVSIIPDGTKYEKYIVSQSQMYLRPNVSALSGEYLVSFLRSIAGQHALLSNTSQVGVPAISRPSSHLKQILLIIPSKKIDDVFVEIYAGFLQKMQNITTLNLQLESIRDMLLPKLISGEIELS